MDELHHRWDDLEADRPLEKLVRRRLVGKRAMLSHVSLEAGCHVPLHSHENEQWAILLTGSLRFELGDEGPDRRVLVVSAGEVLELPPGLPHAATALTDSVVIDVFSPPSETTGVDSEGS
ncbi:MAG: cupin domain-containing protein [Planctomycetota bacterium]|jgi:quercetin dioxygenase-like cupin family protein